ncbi:MAG: anthranilate phosphoribosyltransferase [Candidatus Dadabacteria bacterium]|nr:MAG: anthranilate phosphoribosyltransferase [Candidatus Dadabacteria bacterium]
MSDLSAVLERLIGGETLSATEAEALFGRIMAGQVAPEMIAGLLVALRVRGETAAEVAGAARAMRAAATPVDAPEGAVDIVGTGGDGQHTYNASTAAAIALSAAGVPVVKHGNRSVSSKAGSADVLEALGVPIDLDAQAAADAACEYGFAFLFAPNFHPAMRYAIGPRRALGVRTIFNLLGPLTNPAAVPNIVLGVFGPQWLEPVAEALRELGIRRAMVVHAQDPLDEISLSAPTDLIEVIDGTLCRDQIAPSDFGLRRVSLGVLRGGDAAHNAAAIERAFSGDFEELAAWIALNAAAGLRVARDLDWQEAIGQMREVIDSGRARDQLERLRGLQA